MNYSLCTLFICIFVVAIPLCSSSGTTPPSIVTSICEDIARTDPKNINYDLCVSQLQSDSRASSAETPQIGEISFELTLAKAKEMKSLADQLLLGQTLDQTTKNVFVNCLKYYKLQVEVYLEAGIEALERADYKTAGAKVASAIEQANTCEEGIKGYEKKNVPFDLIRRNYEFYQLAAISIGFTNIVKVDN